jgi:hypothetical protein
MKLNERISYNHEGDQLLAHKLEKDLQKSHFIP